MVLAVTHIGDNSEDRRYAGNRIDLIDRPRQIKAALDWVLSAWPGNLNLNPRRVGVFGFSLGGFTGLVLIGETPEIARMAQLCESTPDAPECTFTRNAHGDQLSPSAEVPRWIHDERIKAAVIAAPAASYLFGPGDLREVSAPVQLWRVEKDSQAPCATILKYIRTPILCKAPIILRFWRPAAKRWPPPPRKSVKTPAGFDRAAFHRTFNQAIADFFTTRLRDR